MLRDNWKVTWIISCESHGLFQCQFSKNRVIQIVRFDAKNNRVTRGNVDWVFIGSNYNSVNLNFKYLINNFKSYKNQIPHLSVTSQILIATLIQNKRSCTNPLDWRLNASKISHHQTDFYTLARMSLKICTRNYNLLACHFL